MPADIATPRMSTRTRSASGPWGPCDGFPLRCCGPKSAVSPPVNADVPLRRFSGSCGQPSFYAYGIPPLQLIDEQLAYPADGLQLARWQNPLLLSLRRPPLR